MLFLKMVYTHWVTEEDTAASFPRDASQREASVGNLLWQRDSYHHKHFLRKVNEKQPLLLGDVSQHHLDS